MAADTERLEVREAVVAAFDTGHDVVNVPELASNTLGRNAPFLSELLNGILAAAPKQFQLALLLSRIDEADRTNAAVPFEDRGGNVRPVVSETIGMYTIGAAPGSSTFRYLASTPGAKRAAVGTKLSFEFTTQLSGRFGTGGPHSSA
ncbi:MAG TPA: hypothetical protein VE621_18465 [Bryobacteraceae bacterium]|nr:hypothetical protein [Bryobacteraceae bacterium]